MADEILDARCRALGGHIIQFLGDQYSNKPRRAARSGASPEEWRDAAEQESNDLDVFYLQLHVAWATTLAEPTRLLLSDLEAAGWPYQRFTEHGGDQALIRRFLRPHPPVHPPEPGASQDDLDVFDRGALGFLRNRGTSFDDAAFDEQTIEALGRHFLQMAERLRSSRTGESISIPTVARAEEGFGMVAVAVTALSEGEERFAETICASDPVLVALTACGVIAEIARIEEKARNLPRGAWWARFCQGSTEPTSRDE